MLNFCACTTYQYNNPSKEYNSYTVGKTKTAKEFSYNKLKGVWISYVELSFSNKSKEYFINKINKMFSDIKQKGFNTLFVHVRSHSDAFYKSKFFPFSYYVSGKQGKDPGFDPLEIMCYFAKIYNLKIHAWINPFRVLTSKNIDFLSDDNPAKKFILAKNGCVKQCEGGYYYNPCQKQVKELILNGIKEIVANYSVDGIHFDDYFYPTTDYSFDKIEYNKYCKNNKEPCSVEKWRRNNIDDLISSVYKVVSEKGLIFGVSPHCSVYYNYNQQYADVEKWCKEKGYIDYIAPQIYFGFECTEKTPDGQSIQFEDCTKYWQKLIKNNTRLYIGLALYRSGEKGEWSQHNDIIARQIKYIKKQKSVDGLIVFSYSYFTSSKRSKNETSNFIKEL